MSLALTERTRMPGLVGTDVERRAETAAPSVEEVKVELKKRIEEYSRQVSILAWSRKKLAHTERTWKTFPFRLWTILSADYLAFGAQNAELSWLSPEHLNELVLWNLEAESHVPLGLKAKKAHEVSEFLLIKHCHRYSKKSCWERGYFYLLNGRAMLARGYHAKLVLSQIELAIRESDRWRNSEGVGEYRRCLAQKCTTLKKNIAYLYFQLAQREWNAKRELMRLGEVMLYDALALAEGDAAFPGEAQSIREYMKKSGLMSGDTTLEGVQS